MLWIARHRIRPPRRAADEGHHPQAVALWGWRCALARVWGARNGLGQLRRAGSDQHVHSLEVYGEARRPYRPPVDCVKSGQASTGTTPPERHPG